MFLTMLNKASFVLVIAQFININSFLILWLFLYFFKSRNKNADIIKYPDITVIIPVKNEEKFIEASILNILNADYPSNKKVIVVDDGSTDDTPAVLKKLKNNIRIITNKMSSGKKALAVNEALKFVDSEITVIVDSDTIVGKNTFTDLIKGFNSPNVASVSAIVKVKNIVNPITFFQAIEYKMAMFLRLIQDRLNCCPTLIGVCSAIKTKILKEAGGMPDDTLIEDGDLSAVLKKKGYITRIINTVVHTYSPETVGSFIRQRKRWTMGRIQVLLKHKDMIFNKKYGLFGMLSFPYESIILLLTVILIPVLFINIINNLLYAAADSIRFIDLIDNTSANFNNIFNFGFHNMPVILIFGIISFNIIITTYLIFCMNEIKTKNKILNIIGFYLSFPYIILLILISLISVISFIHAGITLKKACWYTR